MSLYYCTSLVFSRHKESLTTTGTHVKRTVNLSVLSRGFAVTKDTTVTEAAFSGRASCRYLQEKEESASNPAWGVAGGSSCTSVSDTLLGRV